MASLYLYIYNIYNIKHIYSYIYKGGKYIMINIKNIYNIYKNLLLKQKRAIKKYNKSLYKLNKKSKYGFNKKDLSYIYNTNYINNIYKYVNSILQNDIENEKFFYDFFIF